MLQENCQPITLALFCKVIDNYGDVGICWRLSRQLQQEHGVAVTLWIDDLLSFRRICPEVIIDAAVQQIANVTVRHWCGDAGSFATGEIADIVIEFFGCDIPEGYIAAMAQCQPRRVWINLEGLTAETWVEGCHGLTSPHPRLPLTKYFFYPGFTDKTGGLLREAALAQDRRQFQADRVAVATFLAGLGVTPSEAASFKVSLFCYPHAPVGALFDAWQEGDRAITCLVPEGVAGEAVKAFLGSSGSAGSVRTCGALTVRVLPFVAQPDYDRLLWACDLNFVRGEDSFVRAQWAGRPFIWHIYPQDKDLHHVKLRAFLARYEIGTPSWRSMSLLWNGVEPEGAFHLAGAWRQLQMDLVSLADASPKWEREMLEYGDLTANLLAFCDAVRSEAE
jgi:uncharacterized repeat protein (TIGR03837 family)